MADTTLSDYLYPLDLTGTAPSNKVINEKQTLTPPPAPEDNDGEFTYHFIIPFAAPFFRDSVVLTHITTGRTLVPGTDYTFGHKFISASFETEGAEGGIYASIMFYDRTLGGQVRFDKYQTLGGTWTLNENAILEILSNQLVDPRTVSYEVVSDKPTQFPPLPHNHPVTDVTGFGELITANYDIAAAIRERTKDWLDNPPVLLGDYYNKDQVDALIEATPYESAVALGNVSGTVLVDCTAADMFTATKTGPINWTFKNRPFSPTTRRIIEIRLTNGGNFAADTWPTGTVFSDADKSMTANGTDKMVVVLAQNYIDVTIIREMA